MPVNHLCPCCSAKISVSTVMCQPCWEKLPFPSQWKVWRLFEHEGRSEAFLDALEVACDIVAAYSKTTKKPSQFKDPERGKYDYHKKESA